MTPSAQWSAVVECWAEEMSRLDGPRSPDSDELCVIKYLVNRRPFRCVEGCTFKVSNLLKRRLCTARGVDEKRRRN